MDSLRIARAVLVPVLLLSVAACGATHPVPLGRPAPGGPVLYPAPPDTPRIQFLAAFTTEEDLVGRKGRSVVDRIVGANEEGTDRVEGIRKPYGVAMNRGRLYVCDTDQMGVIVMDLRARTFERFTPRGEGVLKKPINCAVEHDDGRLFVTDTERGQVVVFDSLRNYVGSIGEQGARPSDVFVDGDGIWVSDLATATVRLYDPVSFALVRSFPGADPGAGRLVAPANLWVEGDEVFVSDLSAFTVKVFDRQGRYRRSIGSLGRAPGQFSRPKGVAVDRSGNVYVVDAAFENVQVFDKEGQVLTYFGGSYSGPGDMWLPAQVAISYDDLDLFRDRVDPRFEPRYLIVVTNQYGPDRVSVYAFLTPRGGAIER